MLAFSLWHTLCNDVGPADETDGELSKIGWAMKQTRINILHRIITLRGLLKNTSEYHASVELNNKLILLLNAFHGSVNTKTCLW